MDDELEAGDELVVSGAVVLDSGAGSEIDDEPMLVEVVVSRLSTDVVLESEAGSETDNELALVEVVVPGL